MGFDIQKKKIALAVEPNVQLTNFIGRYPESALGRKVMISFGVNIMGLNAIPIFPTEAKGKEVGIATKKYGFQCNFCALDSFIALALI
jgi:hypothetical protein